MHVSREFQSKKYGLTRSKKWIVLATLYRDFSQHHCSRSLQAEEMKTETKKTTHHSVTNSKSEWAIAVEETKGCPEVLRLMLHMNKSNS